MYQGLGGVLLWAMTYTELCVVHPGSLSASSWSRVAAHLPAGHARARARARGHQPVLVGRLLADRRGAGRPAARDARPARRARARRVGRRRRGRRRARDAAGRSRAPRRRARRARPRRSRADSGRPHALVRDVHRRAPRPPAARRPRPVRRQRRRGARPRPPGRDARRRPARGHHARGAAPPVLPARSRAPARPRADPRLHPLRAAADGGQGGREHRPRQLRPRLGALRLASRCSPAAATTIRC